jgi:ABC-type transporter Mla MlaB component
VLRIECSSEGETKVVHLAGRVKAEHINELEKQLKDALPQAALNLAQVTLVDSEVVEFLGACEASGIELRGCSMYVREWIDRGKMKRSD